MFVILLSLFLNFGWAVEADLNIEGEGRFISEEGDSLPFIKEQLLFNSFQDVITKYLKKQGLDSDLFWEKHEQRFDSFFTYIEKDLRKNYQSDPKTSLEPSKIEKEVRIKRLERKAQFGLLNRAIKSYSIISMTRAQNMPKARYISISGQVDSNLVNQIYFEYTSPKKTVKALNLYLMPLFTLSNISWTEIGITSVNDFSQVVSDHWKKYLENGLKPQIQDIISLGEDSQSDLRRTLESKQGGKGFFELGDLGGRNFDDGFLLMVKIQLKKISEKVLLKKSQMEIFLNFSLIDLRNNRIIAYGDLPKTRSNFSTEDISQLSSSIATDIYRIPLEEFSKLKKDINNNLGNSNLLYLKVRNINSVEDLIGLADALKMKGVSFQLNPRIHSLKAKEGVLELDFNGNQAEAEKFLKEFEKEKLMDGRGIIFEEQNGDYTLAIKPSGIKKNQSEQGEVNENKKRVVL
jgi:hypothetical protein